MSTGSTTATNSHFEWRGWLAKQGFNAVLLAAFAWFLGSQIVIPMRDDQKAFMQSVIKTNETNAATHVSAAAAMQQLTQVQHTQAQTLTTLVDQQRQTTSILQQIRDDQRSGAWRDNTTAKQ